MSDRKMMKREHATCSGKQACTYISVQVKCILCRLEQACYDEKVAQVPHCFSNRPKFRVNIGR